jgi:hypothetical protein
MRRIRIPAIQQSLAESSVDGLVVLYLRGDGQENIYLEVFPLR